MKAILTSLALLAAPLASPVALAQSDGTLGSSSTGTLNFNVNISDANRVQIFGFSDMVQTIETGQRTKTVGNSYDTIKVPPVRSVPRPCITADLPGTLVSVDWVVTPLTNQMDDTQVIRTEFNLYREVTGAIGSGTKLREINTQIPASLTMSGVEARAGGHGSRCQSSDIGRLGFTIDGRDIEVEAANPGTYVSTITVTVKPE